MSSERRQEAKIMAVEKYREATLWRTGLDKSVRRWRTWAIYYIAQQYQIQCAEREQRFIPRRWRKESDRAHDMLLSIKENIRSLALAVEACELGGRIYEEEHEEREWALARRMEEDVYDGN